MFDIGKCKGREIVINLHFFLQGLIDNVMFFK